MSYPSSAEMSFVYKGFLVQKSKGGWIVPQMPNYAPGHGQISPGPYAEPYAAKKMIDLISTSGNAVPERTTHSYDYESPSWSYEITSPTNLFGKVANWIFYIVIFLVALYIFGGVEQKQFVLQVALVAWNIFDSVTDVILKMLK